MSVFNSCIGCLEDVDLLTMLKLTIVVDSDGSYYLNTKFNEKEQCDDYDPAALEDYPESFWTVSRQTKYFYGKKLLPVFLSTFPAL